MSEAAMPAWPPTGASPRRAARARPSRSAPPARSSLDGEVAGVRRIALEDGLELVREAHGVDRGARDQPGGRDPAAGEQEDLDRPRAVVDIELEAERAVVDEVADHGAVEMEHRTLGVLADLAGLLVARLDGVAGAERGGRRRLDREQTEAVDQGASDLDLVAERARRAERVEHVDARV